jgi:hypothetical protein
MGEDGGRSATARPGQKLLGSLREALAAASRESPSGKAPEPPLKSEERTKMIESSRIEQATPEAGADAGGAGPLTTAAEAVRHARGGSPNIPPTDRHVEGDRPPTTRVMRKGLPADEETPQRTRLLRGKQKLARQAFHRDPVVGWLVIVGGPGLGAYRPIYEGNNSVGRAANQRIPIDFGDDAISSEEQAYIRYDGADRSFLFVPNLAKTNVVSVNDKRPSAAVTLQAMDVIMMGHTQLVFVPFCGPEFDWSEISDVKE